jgi:hypothetical protein
MFNELALDKSPEQVQVYFELGNKRVFASAVNWPGWCRSGRDEGLALQALLGYGPRYAEVLNMSGSGFQSPGSVAAFTVIERLKGNVTTDFGAPAIAPTVDADLVDDTEIERFKAILRACWSSFDQAVIKATGKELRPGPRGGGRNLEKIVQHVLGVEVIYLSMLSKKITLVDPMNSNDQITKTRDIILNALETDEQSDAPRVGPHGGKRWTLRFFVRRLAWHVLDHKWEIEDRII